MQLILFDSMMQGLRPPYIKEFTIRRIPQMLFVYIREYMKNPPATSKTGVIKSKVTTWSVFFQINF